MPYSGHADHLLADLKVTPEIILFRMHRKSLGFFRYGLKVRDHFFSGIATGVGVISRLIAFKAWDKDKDQQSARFTGIFMARPPSEVSLYFEFISWAVSHIVLITLSRETFADAGFPSNAR